MPAPIEPFAHALDDLVAVHRTGEQQQTGGDEFFGVAAGRFCEPGADHPAGGTVRTSSRPWATSASSAMTARISGRSTR